MRAGARTYKAALPGTVRAFFAVAAPTSPQGNGILSNTNFTIGGWLQIITEEYPTFGSGDSPPGDMKNEKG